MRTPAEVRQKLKQVIFRLRKKALDQLMTPHPEHCAHNARVRLADTGVSVGVCRCPSDGLRGMACDSRISWGRAQARNCPHWSPVKSPEEIKTEFKSLFQGSRDRISAEYPGAAALLWVLNPYDETQDSNELAEAGAYDDDRSTDDDPPSL